MNHFAKLAALLAPLLFVAALTDCAGPGSSAAPAKSSRMGRQILPLPPDGLLSFTDGGAEVLDRNTRAPVRPLSPAPVAYGRPIASCVDLGSLMAAVVLEHGLAVLNLTSPEVEPVWLPLQWAAPPTSVFVSDAYAATLGGSEACLWDLTNAVLVFKVDLAAWSRDNRLGPAVCVVPDRANPKRATVLFSSAESTDIQVLDFSHGAPQKIASSSNIFQNTKKSWYIVERCAYDGERLFLSGTQEISGTNSSGQVVPQAAPFLMKVDLATREFEPLFKQDTHSLDQDVEELAAAGGCVASLRRDGLLRVFREGKVVYEKPGRPGRAIAWLSETSLAIYDANSVDVIDVP